MYDRVLNTPVTQQTSVPCLKWKAADNKRKTNNSVEIIIRLLEYTQSTTKRTLNLKTRYGQKLTRSWVTVLENISKRPLSLFSIINTAQKMKFSIKNFFSKCDQIRRKLRIWSHLLRKSLMENFIFCAVFPMTFLTYLLEGIKNDFLPLFLNLVN